VAALTLGGIKAAFYAVLKSDSAGTSVRASLGAGAGGVLQRRGLSLTLPVAPFLAITFGPMTGAREDVRTLFPTVWLYDDPTMDWARLHALAALIEAVYVDDVIASCYTNYAGGIGEEVTDAALQQRPALAMRYQVRGRF
jgi:hypothetical protein